jgi:hypothetical protein
MTTSAVTPAIGPRTMRVLGEFASAQSMIAAVDALKVAGFSNLETFAPFDIPDLDARLGLHRSQLGWIVVAGGIVGLVLGYGIQWWANVYNYPLNSGGRPVHAIPAFIFPTFEGVVLCAALAAFFGLFALLGLPRLWAPIDEVEGFGRASVDRFWIAVGNADSDGAADEVQRVMREAGAVNTFAPAEL